MPSFLESRQQAVEGEEERVRVEMLIVKVEKRDTQDRNVKKEEKEKKKE